MARIRTIKPEFFTSEQIVECSTSARLLFVGLWCFCDDNGVHPASAKRLKMEVFPGDAITDDEIGTLVDELINNRLLIEFNHKHERFWSVTGWKKHQKIDKPSTKYPTSDDKNSTIIRRTLDDHSPIIRDGMESNGMESNGEKGVDGVEDALSHSSNEEILGTENRNGADDLTFPPGPTPAFNEFYDAYPRKIGKRDAMKAYEAAVAEQLDAKGIADAKAQAFLLEAATAYAASPAGQDGNGTDDFRPSPAKWLEDGRYDDDRKEWLKPNVRAANKPNAPAKPKVLPLSAQPRGNAP